MVNSELQNRVERTVEKYLTIATEHFGTTVPKIPYHYKSCGTTAGKYSYKSNIGFMIFNYVLLNENIEHFINHTIPHEIAHYVVHFRKLLGDRKYKYAKPHGQEWKYVMSRIFGVSPDRCHKYDVTNARKRTVARPYIYKCKCREHQFTNMRHRKSRSGVNYICRYCKGTLVFDRVE